MINVAWLYVGALYGVAIAIARRYGAAIRWRFAILFYGLVLLFFFRPLTGPFVNVPVDVLRGIPPWQYISAERTAVNPEQNDLPLQIVPWAHQVRESWKALRAPIWNAAAGGGYPLLANGQSSALSPLRILALPLPLGCAMAAEGAMKVLVGLTFMFLYCRQRGRSELASATAAVMFGLSGFIVSWLHFPLVTAACFLPAVLYATDRVVARPSRSAITSAAVIWAFVIFAGHPETAAHIFLFTALYVVWTMVQTPSRWKILGAYVAVMAIATLLAAPFLGPFVEALPKGRRIHDLQVTPFGSTTMPYADWKSAVLLLQPHFFGRVPEERAWGPAETEALGGYTGVLGATAFFALLAYVIARRAWRSFETFLVIATIAIFGILQAWPGLSDAIHFILPLAAHARMRLLFVFLLAVQAAIVIDVVPRRFLLIGVGATSVLLIALFAGVDFPDRSWMWTTFLSTLPSLAVLVAAVMTVRWRTAGTVALLGAVAIELIMFGIRWNAVRPADLMYPPTPMLQAMDKIRSQSSHAPFRIVGTGAVLFPNTAAIYGYEDVRAHDPMANGRYLDFARETAGYDYRKYFAMWENVTVPVIDYLNVKYLLTYVHVHLDGDHFRLLYSGPDGRIYENLRVLPRFYAVRNVVLEFNDQEFLRRLRDMGDKWPHTALIENLTVTDERMRGDFFAPRPADAPEAHCSIVSADSTDYRLSVDAPRYSLIASSVPWWPGWKVSGDRVSALRVNGAFLGFVVPPGHSSVRVFYDPWTFRYGVLVSLITVLCLIGAAAARPTGS